MGTPVDTPEPARSPRPGSPGPAPFQHVVVCVDGSEMDQAVMRLMSVVFGGTHLRTRRKRPGHEGKGRVEDPRSVEGTRNGGPPYRGPGQCPNPQRACVIRSS